MRAVSINVCVCVCVLYKITGEQVVDTLCVVVASIVIEISICHRPKHEAENESKAKAKTKTKTKTKTKACLACTISVAYLRAANWMCRVTESVAYLRAAALNRGRVFPFVYSFPSHSLFFSVLFSLLLLLLLFLHWLCAALCTWTQLNSQRLINIRNIYVYYTQS